MYEWAAKNVAVMIGPGRQNQNTLLYLRRTDRGRELGGGISLTDEPVADELPVAGVGQISRMGNTRAARN